MNTFSLIKTFYIENYNVRDIRSKLTLKFIHSETFMMCAICA